MELDRMIAVWCPARPRAIPSEQLQGHVNVVDEDVGIMNIVDSASRVGVRLHSQSASGIFPLCIERPSCCRHVHESDVAHCAMPHPANGDAMPSLAAHIVHHDIPTAATLLGRVPIDTRLRELPYRH